MGVLQRIAVAFLIGALICVYTPRKYLHWIAAAILLGYWALLAFAGGADPYSLENNLVRQIDIALLGADHLYGGFGMQFDPEGLTFRPLVPLRIGTLSLLGIRYRGMTARMD